MKYIDAEKLKNEIKRQADLYQDAFIDDMRDKLIDFIDACMPGIVPDKESLNESQQEFVNIVTERMLKEGPIPTLKGKQKAEFEKEFNRFKQITGMINFPAHMEVYKRIILWFMAWGADNLPNLNKVTDPDELDFQQEQPSLPSNLDEAAKEFANREFPDESAVGQWGTGDYEQPVDMEYPREIAEESFRAGAEWAVRQGVDFKIEERKWVHDAVDNIFPEDGDFMSEVDFRKILKDTARHFYELGKNSK